MFTAMAHQRRVVPRMIAGNILLVWEPGAGKTYPVLAACNFIKGPLLCIVPAHLREQWLEQAQTHAPLRSATILKGTKIKIPQATFDSYEIFICSYEYVATLARWKQLRRHKWGAIALDEAHYLMNGKANRTHAIFGAKPLTNDNGLVHAADAVWCLTGTPFTFPNQIYPLLAALFPSALERTDGSGPMSAKEWEAAFCQTEMTSFGPKIVGAQNVPELRARLAPVLDKVKLIDATDMPPLIVDTIPVVQELRKLLHGLDPLLLNKYDILNEILADDDISDAEKLSFLSESGLVMAQIRHHIAVAKIKPTVEIVRSELRSGVKKIIVFGWHKEPLKALARELRSPIITGDTAPKAKREAKETFLHNPDCRVLAGQISSIGTGTDGLQEVCSRSLFMEASWAYRENKQCLHRTYRKGQTRPCHTSFVTLKGSVDEYVARVLKRNAETIGMALD